MQLLSLITLATASLFALSTTALPLLEERAAEAAVGAPYGRGKFELIGIAAGSLYQYGGYWIQSSSLGSGTNNAVMTRNQTYATQFKYHGKTQDVYYHTKSGNITTQYSMVLTDTPINSGPSGYYYVNINSGYAKSNFTFDPDFVYLVPPSSKILAVCYETVGPNPGLGLLWRDGDSTASSSCLDVNMKAIFNEV